MRVLLLLQLLLLSSGTLRPVAGTLSAVGQEPWIVVWKKGVDGDLLYRTLCPTFSTGDDTKLGTGEAEDGLFAATRGLKAANVAELALNCSARFTHLFNGFAGHFTLKEMEAIKAQFKNSIDFVISDKAVQVDSPSLPTGVSTGWEDAAPSAAAEHSSVLPAAPADTPSMVLDVGAEGSHQHSRQLLFTPPKLVAGAQRRMLPEEHNATWGLDILDQGGLPLDTIYNYTFNGTGVHIYVLDTGIRTTHKEFIDPETGRTRAVHAFDAVYNSNSSEDCHGHGSHVSAIVGGNTFGVAKNVTLHAVRVLACDGTAMVSALLKGLDWVAKHHIKPAIAHMSIEGSFSSIVNSAVEQLIKVNHVHVVVSSGNSGKDACLASPASSPSAITVAAVDDHLARWQYANWGACVDVFAPGVAILSAVSNYGDSGTALKTGTSMAAPFVTGVVAAYLETHPGASPEEVQQKLYQKAMRGAVLDDAQGFATMFPGEYPDLMDISSTPNRLLQANLTAQADVSPGKLLINDSTTELVISIKLTSQPSQNVTASVTMPPAWDGTPMAAVTPAQLQFSADDWDQPKALVVQPRPVCDGDYFITLNLWGAPEDGFPALHTVLVSDSRMRSGENAAMSRVIRTLPFNDTGDTTAFADNYRCQDADASPDVVYSYTPPADADAAISTCGSGFDTKLLVTTNLSDPSTYMCNDDDRNCFTNKACSKLDVTFKAGVTYFIVVDGYGGASGEFTLSITCNSKCPPASDPASTVTEDGSASDAVNDTPNGHSPSSSDLLMQTLFQYSRHPKSDRGAQGSSSSPSPVVPAVASPAPQLEPSPEPAASPAVPTAPSPAPTLQPHTPPISGAVGGPPPGPSHAASPHPGAAPGGTVSTAVPSAKGNGRLPAGPRMQGPIATLLGQASSFLPLPDASTAASTAASTTASTTAPTAASAAASASASASAVVGRSLLGVATLANATNVAAEGSSSAAPGKVLLIGSKAAHNATNSSISANGTSNSSKKAPALPLASPAVGSYPELVPDLVGPIHLGHNPAQAGVAPVDPSEASLLGGSGLAHAGPRTHDLQDPATASDKGPSGLAHAGNRVADVQDPTPWLASAASAQPAAAGGEASTVLTPAASPGPATEQAANNDGTNEQSQPTGPGKERVKGWDFAGEDLRGATIASLEQLPLLAEGRRR